MATFANKMYGRAPLAWLNKEVDILDDVIKVMLVTSGYTFDQDAHDYKNDVTAEIAASGGYTSGGATLANKTLTYTGASNTVKFDADDVVYPGATITFRSMVFYDATPGTDATRPLICCAVGDSDTVSTGGDLTLQWNTGGIFEIVAAA